MASGSDTHKSVLFFDLKSKIDIAVREYIVDNISEETAKYANYKHRICFMLHNFKIHYSYYLSENCQRIDNKFQCASISFQFIEFVFIRSVFAFT